MLLFSLPVPRLLFDGWSGADYQALFGSEDLIEDCIQVIVNFYKVHNLNPVEAVLIPSCWKKGVTHCQQSLIRPSSINMGCVQW